MWSNLKNYSDGALLVIRAIFGALYGWLYGWPLLAGGLRQWERYGLKQLDIDIFPGFWGFLTAFSGTVGCLLMIIGLFFRPSCLLLLTMVLLLGVAEYAAGGLGRAMREIELLLFLLTLFFVGPGRFSFDKG